MTLNQQHIDEWADALSSTTERQADGALFRVKSDGTQSFCCLGFGAVKCAGLGFVKPLLPHVSSDDDDEGGAMVPVAGESGLAPWSFMLWLGYEEPEDDGDPDFQPATNQSWDVAFNFPDHLRVRSERDFWAKATGGDSSQDDGAISMRHGLTASALNDTGFTFAQIADVIRYFGLHPKPTT